MAAQKGRALIVKFKDISTGAFVAIAGARNGSISINNEIVDITNKDNESTANGALYRHLLEQGGVTSLSVPVDGVFTDAAIQEDMLEAAHKNLHKNLEIVIPGTNGGTFSGPFAISAAEMSGVYNTEVTYSATFESAGEITYTAST